MTRMFTTIFCQEDLLPCTLHELEVAQSRQQQSRENGATKKEDPRIWGPAVQANGQRRIGAEKTPHPHASPEALPTSQCRSRLLPKYPSNGSRGQTNPIPSPSSACARASYSGHTQHHTPRQTTSKQDDDDNGPGDVLQSVGAARPHHCRRQGPAAARRQQQHQLRSAVVQESRRRVGRPRGRAAAAARLPVQERRGRSAGGGRQELGHGGAGVRDAGAGGVLGAVVRAVPDDRAGDRRAGQGVRGADQVLQGEHGRLPQRGLHLRHPQHPHRAHLQGRREEGDRDRRRPQVLAHQHHRQVRRQLVS